MNKNTFGCRALSVIALLLSVFFGIPGSSAASPQEGPVRVCATVPDLASLVREIGGEEVSVTVFTKPTEDTHFVEAKPSFVKALSQAELFVLMGLDLEAGYAPVLVRNARNENVLFKAKGYVDASSVIQPIEVPAGTVDRSMGDVHPFGNPHYLHDPLNGLKVSEYLKNKLSETRPAKKQYFEGRYEAFRSKLGEALVGKTLAGKYKVEFEKLARLHEHGKLLDYVKKQGEEASLGGWLGAIAPFYGAKAVADHNQWPYFAIRFGLTIVGSMEPKPGITPTTKHLSGLVEMMKRENVKLVLAAPYYDPKHAKFLAEKTGGTIVEMAHLVGARQGTDDYVSMVDYNVKRVVAALKGGK